MKNKRYIKILSFIAICLFLSVAFPVYASEENNGKSIIFVLDTSGSMRTNDPERLAIDSIAQLIYTLPTDYKVGFVAYNSDIIAEQIPVISEQRNQIMKVAESSNYSGYSNAGSGLWRAVEFLQIEQASEKYIVLLSDGEILMESDSKTEEAQKMYQNAIDKAVEQNIKVHVIGLGDEMQDMEKFIFDAADITGGKRYHTPQALDIQSAIDAILEEELDIKQSTIAIIDADGEMEMASVELPYTYADKVRIVITSTAPIQNLSTNFQASRANQINGERYSLIEVNEPYGTEFDLSFEGTKDNQVRINVIPEYRVIPKAMVTYQDEIPAEEDAVSYQRTAQISCTFHDLDNPDIQLWTDSYFEHNKLKVKVNGEEEELTLKEGVLYLTRQVQEAENLEIEIDYSQLPINIIGVNKMEVTLEEPPLLPIIEEEPPYVLMAAGIAAFLLVLIIIVIVWRTRRPKPVPIVAEEKPEPGKYSYVGKLNIYVTRTQSGYDIPPLSYNLFRLPAGRVISLKEVLEDCDVKEEFVGAESIYFKSGTNRSLIMTNNSDCTIMKNREILMKRKSYQLALNSKVDITFEDEISELMVQYKDLKPSEMR